MLETNQGPGRSCPIHYRYRPGELAGAPRVRADVAWVVGGLYGNVEALGAIVLQVEKERNTGARVALVFNGDFHWFDAHPEDFAVVQQTVMAEHAVPGNVELELARPEPGAGCGCAYPGFVDDETVARSNRIMGHLQDGPAGEPAVRDALNGLPRILRLEVGDTVTGVLHGDPESVAGWRFAYENVTGSEQSLSTEQVRAWAEAGEVDAFACTHTCLPWAATFANTVVINNGSAGMPNFYGDRRVLVTRIAADGSPHPDALYAVSGRGACWEAVAVRYDTESWLRRFRRTWPEGSPARESYYSRIVHGPDHDLATVAALAAQR